MRRREFVSAAVAAGAAGVTGCIDGGEGDDGNGTEGNGTDGEGEGPEVTDTSFSSSPARGESQESASYSFDDEGLRVTGVIVGSDACKTAELDSAEYDEGRGAVVVDVVTVDAEDAGDVCAEVLKPIRYEAVVDLDLTYQVRPAVVVTHDGEEVEATENGEAGGGDGASLTGAELEVTGSECGTGVDEAEYTATQAMSEGDESVGVVEGTLSGPDGCTTAELDYVSYDADDDVFVADVRTARTDADACQDCITEVDYRVEATFEGGVAGSAEVSHDGVRVGGVGEGVEYAEFSVEEVENASGGEGTGNAEFDEDEGEIRLSGTIVGSDGCATARLAGASVDDGALEVDVETVGKNTHRRYCTQALVAISYEAVFSFDGEIPDEISLSHDGTGVMSGAYASESISAEPENGSES